MNNVSKPILFTVAILSLARVPLALASWIGDEISASVSNPEYAWDNSSAVVTLAGAEFVNAGIQATIRADFTSDRLIVTYENAGTNDNITIPALTYTFSDLDTGGAIESVTLVSNSSFGQGIERDFTGNSIILNIPLQDTNKGEVFTATYEFTTGPEEFEQNFTAVTDEPLFSFPIFGDLNSPVAAFEIQNLTDSTLNIASAYDPDLGLGAGESVQDDFVIYDGTLQVEVATSDPQGGRADVRTTYRMRLDGRRLGRDYLRGRYLRQGVTSDARYARMAARAGRIADLRILRFQEEDRKWIRAVRATDARATDIRYLRMAPDGVVGHYGTFTDENGSSFAWAVMDRNSKYVLGINVDNDSDGIFNGDDNCRDLANSDQIDSDADGEGNLCDSDDDNDGIADDLDNCPLDANADQVDADGNGVGDICDADADNDGVVDGLDSCADTAGGAVTDAGGCSIAQLCHCDTAWKNHGAFMKCTAKTATNFQNAGLLTSEEKDLVVSQAASTDCGKRP